jgi:hypothetical protein
MATMERRSTLTDLLHQAALQLAPLSKRLPLLVAVSEVVQAAETSLKSPRGEAPHRVVRRVRA